MVFKGTYCELRTLPWRYVIYKCSTVCLLNVLELVYSQEVNLQSS